MKTANKLAQIARVNQKGMFNLIQNGKVIHSGSYDNCYSLMEEIGGTFTIEKVKEKNPYESLQKKVAWASHQYVRYVKERCKELATKGYGGVEIKIDKTADLFGENEGNSYYSHDFVVKLLQQEGFEVHDTPYCYDAQIYTFAQTYILFWEYGLPFAPSNEKIGMYWK